METLRISCELGMPYDDNTFIGLSICDIVSAIELLVWFSWNLAFQFKTNTVVWAI